jgi:hypothetical protein
MSRAIAAAVSLAATALLAPASALAQAAPNPDPLWSEFPLQPLVATVPTSSTPAPAIEQPVREDPTVRRGDGDRTAGFLILVGAALAAGAGFVGRRRVGKRRDSGGEIQREPERAAVHTFERPVPAGGSGNATGPVAVASRPRTRAVGAGGTLTETLSPQARLADQVEEGETGAELETHQTCEIACWRGYVTWQFYVESDSPHDVSLASPYFRAPGKGAPEQSDVALQAHATLVEALVEAGWEPEGYGEEWFSERFQRPNA